MHLLRVASTGLEDADSPVDLEHSPAEIVVLSFTDTDLAALAAAWRAEGQPSLRLANLQQLRHPLSVDLYVERVIERARIVVVRCLGGVEYLRYGLEQIGMACLRQGATLLVLSADGRPDPRLTALSRAPADLLAAVQGCFDAGGVDNLRLALRTLVGHLAGTGPVELAQPVPAAGLWSPPGVPPASDRPVAVIIFYRSLILSGDLAPITALAAALDRRGLQPLCLFVTGLKDPAVQALLSDLLLARRPAIILNATAFSARDDQGRTPLDATDCPVLQVTLAGSSREAWQQGERGLSAGDLAMSIALPELDGRLIGTAISFKQPDPFDPLLEFAPVRHQPDPGQIDIMAERAARWVRLAGTAVDRRKIAIILSDYPSRAGRTGYAVGLDSAASTIALLGWLGHDGGAAETLLRDLETRQGDSILVPASSYHGWMARHPALAAAITSRWGAVEQDPAWKDDGFCFAVRRAGPCLIALQPDRQGPGGDRASGYHDGTVPPSHGYAAFYLWLRLSFDADALVQMGTHGTLEWLPGKAVAPSPDCWPVFLSGGMPVIYPFIVNNPGEAAVARRRLGAATIGHLTPPIRATELAGPAAELESLLDEYAAAAGLDRRRQALLRDAILDRAATAGLSVARSGDPEDLIQRLDAWLCDLKELAIRDGLHVLGQTPEPAACDALLALFPSTMRDDAAGRLRACGDAERSALLAALSGRFVPAGPAGAPTRGRLDVLPTGRVLAGLDPRVIPTPTAMLVGTKAADALLQRYCQDHGDWPRQVFFDIWASSTLRTGGEDLAQAMALLGVRPRWDEGGGRVIGVEAIPMPVLNRPRVDVVLRISGLFRDAFASQIALFDQAVRLVAELEEEATVNPLVAALAGGEDLSRIFGAGAGEYGAGVAAQVLDTDIIDLAASRDAMADAYLQRSRYAYGAQGPARAADADLRRLVARTDALIHGQDDRDRDWLDSDGVMEHVGGFAQAARALGATPDLLQVDNSRVETPKIRTLAEEVTRLVQGRLIHPGWIDGQLAHGYRGVAELAQSMDALFGFAATAEAVQQRQFDLVYDAWVGDDQRWQQICQHNPAAAGAILRRFRQAMRLDLWRPRRNAVGDELRDRQASLELCDRQASLAGGMA